MIDRLVTQMEDNWIRKCDEATLKKTFDEAVWLLSELVNYEGKNEEEMDRLYEEQVSLVGRLAEEIKRRQK
jgi:hypothetical protein